MTTRQLKSLLKMEHHAGEKLSRRIMKTPHSQCSFALSSLLDQKLELILND